MIKLVKGCFFLIFTLVISPLIALSWLEKQLTNNEGCFLFGAHFCAIIPGPIGKLTRSSYYFFTLDQFNPNAGLGFGSFVYKRGTRIGSNLQTASYVTIGLADIRNDVSIANRASVISGLHEHGNSQNTTNKDYGKTVTERVVIGDKCWLGEGSLVGATVGANAIVGVGAVVISPIPEQSMAMGNPARAIKNGWGKHRLNKEKKSEVTV